MTARDCERVWGVYQRLREEARGRLPGFEVVLGIDPRAGECARPGRCRQFAWCESVRPPRIVVAPRLESQSIARIQGVMRHEFGHAILFSEGRPRHTERDADHVAEVVLGRRIFYDREEVQTIADGVHPRPARLG